MKRCFVDSSVLYSAFYSTRGHSHDLLQMAARAEVQLVVSEYVTEETRRNISYNIPEQAWYFDVVLARVPLEYVQPSVRAVQRAAELVVLKDAPIIAAARQAGVDFLVTLDKKHLLGKPKLADYARTAIVTPREAIEQLTRPI